LGSHVLGGTPLKQIHGVKIYATRIHTQHEFYSFAALLKIASKNNALCMAKRTKKRGRPTHIRAWRKFRGLSQEQLAEQVGLTQATIARLERGDIAYSQPVLEAMAEALNCQPADLIMRDPKQPGSIWSLWDAISPDQQEQAIRVIEALTGKKTGTDN
jgi:transcriptional regulator with XRE-family HTH domain